MARQVKLTPEQLEELQEAARCTTRPGVHTALLVQHGLVIQGRSRFGGWVKITDQGRRYLNTAVPLAAASRPAEAGKLLRGAAPRKRRTAATNAR